MVILYFNILIVILRLLASKKIEIKNNMRIKTGNTNLNIVLNED